MSWGFFSFSIIASFFTLEAVRFGILPRFTDTYYHLLTAWGFIQAGGYVGWDFWQYAPVGRIHIYPPFFHLILALFIKAGVAPLMLGKLFELVIPNLFLITLWYFVKRNFSSRPAFLALFLATSFFGFYFNLHSHLTSTLAMIFGLLALDAFLKKKLSAVMIFLTLGFYTHIGTAWLFAATLLICGCLNKEGRGLALLALGGALFLSSPVIFKELVGISKLSCLGFELYEKYLVELRPLEYLLAGWGLALVARNKSWNYFFLSLLLAGLLFLVYPYRFFVFEGYLAVILLAAVGLDDLYQKAALFNKQYLRLGLVLLLVFIFLVSPSVIIKKHFKRPSLSFGILLLDSSIVRLALAYDYNDTRSALFPEDFLAAAEFIRRSCQPQDIIYSNLDIVGTALGAMSGRASANALLPEIKANAKFDPLETSRIIILTKDEKEDDVIVMVKKYQLEKIGENRLFNFYQNPNATAKMQRKSASLPFGAIVIIALIIMTAWGFGRLKKYLT